MLVKTINHLTATSKDIFVAKLNGDEINFGLVDQQDYLSLFRKLVELEFVEFYFQKEHRACVAKFKTLYAFNFSIHDGGYGFREMPAKIAAGDWIEFSEIIRANDYQVQSGDYGGNIEHLFFMDFENDQRHKHYKKWNFAK